MSSGLNMFFIILIIYYQIQNFQLVCSSSFNALNGQHLQVIWPRWKGNPKGLSGPIKGEKFLETLATRFNFTYEMVRITENRLEPQGKERGLFNYLWDKQVDIIIIGVTLSYERFQVVDLSVPWAFETYSFLIPVQNDTANINAVVKPFQWPVWLGLVISIVCVVVVLSVLDFILFKEPRNDNKLSEDRNSVEHQTAEKITRARPGKQYLYVFGNLLSQGGQCTSKSLAFRLVAGVWCLAAFIFVQSYTSILFTYVLAPVNQPLINSVYDIVEHDDIQLLTRKGSTLSLMVSDPNATGIFLKLRNKLNSFPHSRCNLISDCISSITPGSRNTFVDGRTAQLESIKKHFDQTKKCDLQLASESFMTGFASFALQKRSRYTDVINKGVLEIQQTGIIDYWEIVLHPMPGQCMANIVNSGKTRPADPADPRRASSAVLSLKNLTGAFVVYLIGLSLSFLAFLCELIISVAQRQKLKIRHIVPDKNGEDSITIIASRIKSNRLVAKGRRI